MLSSKASLDNRRERIRKGVNKEDAGRKDARAGVWEGGCPAEGKGTQHKITGAAEGTKGAGDVGAGYREGLL